MSFKKYRLLDLIIFTVLYFVFEFLAQKAATDWFPEQPFSVSLLLPLLLLVIMRWDYWAVPLFVIFGAYLVLITRWPGDFSQYAIYILGNLSLVLTVFLLKKAGKEKVRKSVLYTVFYVAGSYILMELFRSLGAIIFSSCGPEIIVQFLFTDLLNLAFALIVILICRKADGLFEDQKSYLLRVQKEKEE